MGDEKEHERSIKTEKEIINSFQDQKGIYFPQTGKSSDNYTVDSTKVIRSNYEKDGQPSSYLN